MEVRIKKIAIASGSAKAPTYELTVNVITSPEEKFEIADRSQLEEVIRAVLTGGEVKGYGLEEILQKEIEDCLLKLKEPNSSIDSYRCYFEGRKALAESLLTGGSVNVVKLLKWMEEQGFEALGENRWYSVGDVLTREDLLKMFKDSDNV